MKKANKSWRDFLFLQTNTLRAVQKRLIKFQNPCANTLIMILKWAVNQGSFQGGKCLIQKSVRGRAVQTTLETISLASTRVWGSGQKQRLLGPEQWSPQVAGGWRRQSPSFPVSGSQANTKWHGCEPEHSLCSPTEHLIISISRMKENQKTLFLT